jgi:hypothetical protein
LLVETCKDQLPHVQIRFWPSDLWRRLRWCLNAPVYHLEQILAFDSEFPWFAYRLEQRLREMEQRFREVSTEKVPSRLSSELIRLSDQLGGPVDGPREIALSRAELAQLTGTTLFTVSRLLCHWQSLGIVTIRREAVMVRDFVALARITQSE